LGQIIFKKASGEGFLAYKEATWNTRNCYCKISSFCSNQYGDPEYTQCFGSLYYCCFTRLRVVD